MGTYKGYGFEMRCIVFGHVAVVVVYVVVVYVVVHVVVVGDTYLPRYWWSIRKIK